MTNNNIEVPFTNELRKWLVTIGHTHVLNKGVATDFSSIEANEDDPYIIIPLRPEDERFKIRITNIKLNGLLQLK